MFPPPYPPGVRHSIMEMFFQSISFSLRFSCWFLTDSIHLKGRNIICRVAWGTQLFSFPESCHTKCLIFPYKRLIPGGRVVELLYQAICFFLISVCQFSIIGFLLWPPASSSCPCNAPWPPVLTFSGRARKDVPWAKYIGSLARCETTTFF